MTEVELRKESAAAYRSIAIHTISGRRGMPLREARALLDHEMAPLLISGVDPIEATADAVAAILDEEAA